jgi:hypothetical protein
MGKFGIGGRMKKILCGILLLKSIVALIQNRGLSQLSFWEIN